MIDYPYLSKLLRKVESATQLNEDERALLLTLPVITRRFDANQDMISEGEMTRCCCLILEGLACRYKVVRDGERQILSLHIPGDIPDLHSLHIDVMDHTLGALTPVLAGFIAHDAVRRITRSSYRIAEALWRETLIDAAIFREWMVGIGRRSAASRLAHFLCEFITKMKAVGLSDGTICTLPMTQTEIGDALGLSTVHTNKKLRELRGAGLIEIRGRRLKVRDWEGLCRLGEFDPTYLHLR